MVLETLSPSTHIVTDKVFAGGRELFSKSCPVSSADSVGSQLVCHWHTLTLRRAQNLLAGCIFVGVADKSAFALLSVTFGKVTKPTSRKEKQTRADRRIADYYEKIRNSKQEKPFHELKQLGDLNLLASGRLNTL